MATDIKDPKRTINMKAKIMIVGDGTITLNLSSGPVQRIVLAASKEDEQWAGAPVLRARSSRWVERLPCKQEEGVRLSPGPPRRVKASA